MTSIALLSLVLLPLPLIIPSTARNQSLPQFYESLREFPCLPPSPTLLDRLSYLLHKIYFQYLVAGPGYVLQPAERICFDLFIMILLGATIWCAVLVSPPAIRMVYEGLTNSVLSGKQGALVSKADEEAVRIWSGNMSLSVRTIFEAASAVRNATGP
ncbi:hypothetical protein BU26DRAFT_68843 [Trematosphaeria pertusa]|uniref:Uncharacterized protein n=1 Tax=Trematosphaeria pertusa TaxID=390896 RepID=A0A6A6I5Y5_9PLEO|nr:uncharacterized protein BU26DRAFT_68843 [Trematosphaeria pertusa]KAF2245458.1 hypothetical protein BU26DRAFT_68843 [Trematosphaeria pertusa]